MSRAAAQMLAHDMALVDLLRSMAAQCEADASRLIFQPIGSKCELCTHQIPGGCDLRLGDEATQ